MKTYPSGLMVREETRPPTQEELAAKAAAAARASEIAAENAALQKVVDDLKAGRITFGDAKRDEAMLAIVKVQSRTATGTLAAVVAAPEKLIVR